MATSFADLKKNRKDKFKDLSDKMDNMGKGKYSNPEDGKLWKPTVDDAGNGSAIIRFLPAPKGEDDEFKKDFRHGFKGPKGKYYIERSRITLGEEDPVSEMNRELWATGIEENKNLASARKLQTGYFCNIYVVKDTRNPDAEGKVFLYKYGGKIFDMINDAMHPKFDDEQPINPFDFWEGADFLLKCYTADSGFRSYDKSKFSEVKPIHDADGNDLDDDQIKEVWESQHSLEELVDPKHFKSYSELKKHLHWVLELGSTDEDDKDDEPKSVDEQEEVQEEAPKSKKEKPAPKKEEKPKEKELEDDDDDDDDMDFFKQLGDDD